MPIGNDDSGLTKGVKFATSTVGNLVGGVAGTVRGVVGAGGRGIGHTVTGVTGKTGKPVGDAIESLANGTEAGARSVAEGVERAGQGK